MNLDDMIRLYEATVEGQRKQGHADPVQVARLACLTAARDRIAELQKQVEAATAAERERCAVSIGEHADSLLHVLRTSTRLPLDTQIALHEKVNGLERALNCIGWTLEQVHERAAAIRAGGQKQEATTGNAK